MECTGQASVNGDSTNTTVWTTIKSTALALGQIVKDVAADYYFICTTAGTTGSSEPSWVKTAGSTTTDGGATWTCIGAISTFSATWAAPHARLANAFASSWGTAYGSAAAITMFLAGNHAETQASALALAAPGTSSVTCSILCVDQTVAVPPASTAVHATPTASISTTGASTLEIENGGSYSGISFNCGSGATTVGIFFFSNIYPFRFDNCILAKLGTTAAPQLAINFGEFSGSTNYAMGEVVLNNTSLKFGNTGDGITACGTLVWKNSTAFAGSTIPTSLFTIDFYPSANVEIDGVDFSAFSSGSVLIGTAASSKFIIVNCKFPVGMLVVPSAGLGASSSGAYIDVVNCDSGATNYQNARYGQAGSHVTNISVIRTGGASDGVTPVSWQISTLAYCSWPVPFRCQGDAIWNSLLSTNRVVTLAGIWNSAALPNNDQIWIDVEYLGSSATPLASLATETKANVLAAGTALTADSTSQWGSAATARLNSSTYSLGNIIYGSSATNTGGIFFCTGAGTSASSLPGGYASAVDGGAVTDGTATFRAGTRFLLSVILSSPQPAMVGYFRVYIKAALPSTTFYIDTQITLG